ncbi:MAG: 3-deoxy-8-phosphooctulonate synthase [Planctomycetia bacterium]|nr:3-deoxy-8-phosphooctulonate synthase [Planctomycetia bacterium]
MKPIRLGPYSCGDGGSLVVIAGPCVMESRNETLKIAAELSEIAAELRLPLIFKASFDKANRTSLRSYRGPGLERGLEILAEVRQVTGLPVTTDIHEPYQAEPVARVCDVLQVPAFLVRQTELLCAAARTGKPVHAKKGQFLSPGDMRYVVEKLRECGCDQILLCERGTFFGYGRLVNDFCSIPEMRSLGVPVCFDATHSVQRPGEANGGGCTGGNRSMVEPLARAAVAVGCDALFFETHPDPDHAPCDGPNMVPLSEFGPMLRRLLAIRETIAGFSS